MAVGTYFFYTHSELGIPNGATPAPGDNFTTDTQINYNTISISDDDNFLEVAINLATADLNQALAVDLVVNGTTLATAGSAIFTTAAGQGYDTGSGAALDIYQVSTFDSSGAIVNLGFVSPALIGPLVNYNIVNTLHPTVEYAALAAPPCFTRGTLIDTEFGARPVEDIAEGDLVVTLKNGLQPVRWVARRKVPGRGAFAPVCFRAGALGNGADLKVSPMHRMLLSGPRAELLFDAPEALAHAVHLVDGDQIFRAPCDEVEYFHLLFDDHEIIRAHGCWSESFAPRKEALDGLEAQTRAELLALFPELETTWQDALPTLSAAELTLWRTG